MKELRLQDRSRDSLTVPQPMPPRLPCGDPSWLARSARLTLRCSRTRASTGGFVSAVRLIQAGAESFTVMHDEHIPNDDSLRRQSKNLIVAPDCCVRTADEASEFP